MYSWEAKEEDEDEVEDGDLLGLTGGKSLTIFLVEATKVMGESREGDPDEYSALQVKYLGSNALLQFCIFRDR